MKRGRNKQKHVKNKSQIIARNLACQGKIHKKLKNLNLKLINKNIEMWSVWNFYIFIIDKHFHQLLTIYKRISRVSREKKIRETFFTQVPTTQQMHNQPQPSMSKMLMCIRTIRTSKGLTQNDMDNQDELLMKRYPCARTSRQPFYKQSNGIYELSLTFKF